MFQTAKLVENTCEGNRPEGTTLFKPTAGMFFATNQN